MGSVAPGDRSQVRADGKGGRLGGSMTIGRKIWGGFGLTAAVPLVIGLISFWRARRLIIANGFVSKIYYLLV
jgi:hypothetical protein